MKLSNLIALLTNRTVAGNAYVKDGELYQGNTAQAILVKDENELNEVKKHVAPGSIAYTAGCASVWQLDASGTWQEIQEEGGSGGFSPDITNPQDGDTLVYNATAGKWVNGEGGGGGGGGGRLAVHVTSNDGVFYADHTAGEIIASANTGAVIAIVTFNDNENNIYLLTLLENYLDEVEDPLASFTFTRGDVNMILNAVSADDYPSYDPSDDAG